MEGATTEPDVLHTRHINRLTAIQSIPEGSGWSYMIREEIPLGVFSNRLVLTSSRVKE